MRAKNGSKRQLELFYSTHMQSAGIEKHRDRYRTKCALTKAVNMLKKCVLVYLTLV